MYFLWQTDADLRLACLLLYAFDREDNFWQLYSDFLPSAEECTSLLLATEVCERFKEIPCISIMSRGLKSRERERERKIDLSFYTFVVRG